ncbi:glutamate 5-kinase [Streptomyces antimicrobicus]|uniref:Glutamate 5-kinase n=1 Tax=Streptomyces antimicrobicus TaxID=2883108 RepID=A0ABS8B1B7_9ACTN|nr:glutamate 5-kinase [Streptomyces antimicrobicus]
MGSSSLTTASGGLDAERLDALVDALAAARARGEQLVLVSSGAIAAGLAPLGLAARPEDLAHQQAAASVGQGLLIARYTASFARYGIRVGQVLLTNDDMAQDDRYGNARRTLDALLALGVLPVVNENDTTATDEIRFGDNDRLAALVAGLVRADRLVLLSDVDGVYDADPRLPGSRRIPEVRTGRELDGLDLSFPGSGLGSGGMATKVAAARTATGAGITVRLTAASRVADALAGRPCGTLFHAAAVERGAGAGDPAAGAGGRVTGAEFLAVVADVTGRSGLSLADAFHDIGGTSLQAMRICARLRRRTGVPLLPQALFESATLGEFLGGLFGREFGGGESGGGVHGEIGDEFGGEHTAEYRGADDGAHEGGHDGAHEGGHDGANGLGRGRPYEVLPEGELRGRTPAPDSTAGLCGGVRRAA